jgi:hypothetical protein
MVQARATSSATLFAVADRRAATELAASHFLFVPECERIFQVHPKLVPIAEALLGLEEAAAWGSSAVSNGEGDGTISPTANRMANRMTSRTTLDAWAASKLGVPRYVAREYVRGVGRELSSSTPVVRSLRIEGQPAFERSVSLRLHHLASGTTERTLTGDFCYLRAPSGVIALIGSAAQPTRPVAEALMREGAALIWDGQGELRFERAFSGVASSPPSPDRTSSTPPPTASGPRVTPIRRPIISQLWLLQRPGRELGFRLESGSAAEALTSVLRGITSTHCASEWHRLIDMAARQAEETPVFLATAPAELRALGEAAADYMRGAERSASELVAGPVRGAHAGKAPLIVDRDE